MNPIATIDKVGKTAYVENTLSPRLKELIYKNHPNPLLIIFKFDLNQIKAMNCLTTY